MSSILQDIRHEKILDKLRSSHSVQVVQLAKELNISESTIRRDINELDRQGKLKKVHGGAVSRDFVLTAETTDVAQRKKKNVEKKDSIAKYAASLIEDTDFVYIDAGTTTERMIDYLAGSEATYVTNGLSHASKLMENGLKVYMIGGELRPSTEATVGARAVESVGRYNFTKCFMGANGIDADKGFSTPHIDEAAIKEAAMRRSFTTYVLADNSKFGVVSSVTFAAIDEATIITDYLEDDRYHKYTEIKQVENMNKRV